MVSCQNGSKTVKPWWSSNINGNLLPQFQWELEPLDERVVAGGYAAGTDVNDDAVITSTATDTYIIRTVCKSEI